MANLADQVLPTSYGPDDSWATFSNYSKSVVSGNPVTSAGKAIDLILPGVDIVSCYKDANYARMSGTSMASPHAAGLVALYIVKNGRANDGAGVTAIRQALINGGKAQTDLLYGLATQNDPDGNKENLGWAALTGEAVDNPPVANAGPDQSVALPEGNSVVAVTLDGSGSTDDKGITTYNWKEGTNTLGTGVTLNVNFAQGLHTVVLTVTDTKGQTNTDDVTIYVTAPAVNKAPTADFSFTTNYLVVTFSDNSIDTDGTISSRSWDFGDEDTSTDQNPSHTFGAAGTYNVTLTVTDDDGATGSKSQVVTVTSTPEPSDILLVDPPETVISKNKLKVTLTWTGGASPYTVLRNGSTIASNITTTTYTNVLTKKGAYIYTVCDANGCSNMVTVTF